MSEPDAANDAAVAVQADAAAASSSNADELSLRDIEAQVRDQDIEAQVRDVLLTAVDSVPDESSIELASTPAPALPSPVDSANHSQLVAEALPVDAEALAVVMVEEEVVVVEEEVVVVAEEKDGQLAALIEKDGDAEGGDLVLGSCAGAEEAEQQGVLKSPRRAGGLDIDVGLSLSEDHEQLVEEARLMLAMIDGHHLAYWQSRYDDELTRVEMMSEGGGAATGALFTWYGHDCARATLALTLLFLAPIDGLDDGNEAVDDSALEQQQQQLAGMRALDLGCGNGLFCCMLASGGVGEVMGVDYADSAVELAKGVRGMFPAITEKQCKFEQVDVLGGGAVMKALAHDGGGFDLVHDCGLVDSVAMVRDSASHDIAALVVSCLKPSAVFVCRSCNHGLDELQTIFACHLDLEFYDEAWYGVLLTVWRKPAL